MSDLASIGPYTYPEKPHQRRHGPVGYSTYESYRPWLEDEFSFRCVYCLKRMVWAPTDIWAIDHAVPKEEALHLVNDYENLLFSCQCCNRQKSFHRLADPCKTAYGLCLRFETTGFVTALDSTGVRIVNTIRLNHPRYVEERLKTLRQLQLAAQYDLTEYERLMGFPARMTDLSTLKPPGGNHRKGGIDQSLFARRARGDLPKVY